jgi:predicted lactoylglutathione lyase
MRMIFVNLPVKDLDAAKSFYEAVGFTNNPVFTDDTAAAMVVEENIVVMLLTEPRFKDFITGDIADAGATKEVLNALSADSRAEVDEVLAKARAAGATPWKPVMDEGPMYGGSFADLDGHVWEVLHMDMSAVGHG